jgi:hypothetical protein
MPNPASTNTRMPGGKSAAPNCRFEASVTVHSLRSGGVMSAMRQLRQCVERYLQYYRCENKKTREKH